MQAKLENHSDLYCTCSTVLYSFQLFHSVVDVADIAVVMSTFSFIRRLISSIDSLQYFRCLPSLLQFGVMKEFSNHDLQTQLLFLTCIALNGQRYHCDTKLCVTPNFHTIQLDQLAVST